MHKITTLEKNNQNNGEKKGNKKTLTSDTMPKLRLGLGLEVERFLAMQLHILLHQHFGTIA